MHALHDRVTAAFKLVGIAGLSYIIQQPITGGFNDNSIFVLSVSDGLRLYDHAG